jgi:hypothetical protein
LQQQLGDLAGTEFECHAGAEYLQFGLIEGLRSAGGTILNPTEGLGLGRQLSFYKDAVERSR